MNKPQSARRVQLRDAKAGLSAIVLAAERGEETVITRHGKAVARVVPEPAEAEPKRVDNPGSPYHGMTFLELLMAMPEDLELIRDKTPLRATTFG